MVVTRKSWRSDLMVSAGTSVGPQAEARSAIHTANRVESFEKDCFMTRNPTVSGAPYQQHVADGHYFNRGRSFLNKEKT
jgi:hypothetical protein